MLALKENEMFGGRAVSLSACLLARLKSVSRKALCHVGVAHIKTGQYVGSLT